MRVILFTGKGGAGASTLAAATAIATAAGGRRTLALGLGRGLSHAFECALGDQPGRLSDRLWAMEASGGRPDEPGPLLAWMRDLFHWRGMDEAAADDVAALPGVMDLGRLLALQEQLEGGRFDAVIVDGPALGHCLDLLAALDAASRALERLLPNREPTVLDPFLKALGGYSADGEEVYAQGRRLLMRLAALRSHLGEPDSASVRMTIRPDRISVAEAQRAVAALSLFAYPLDAVLCNRLLPSDAGDWSRPRRKDQLAAAEDAGRSLQPLPVLAVPLQRRDVYGLPALTALAALAYGHSDPGAVLHRGPAQAFGRRDGAYVLTLALPFVRRQELAIERLDDVLIVHVGERSRSFDLPDEVQALEQVASTFDGETLQVTFSR